MEKKMSYEYFKEKVLSPQYKYYNNNPLKISARDCVIRAIAAGLHKDWETVYRELTEYSIQTGYIQNTTEVYSKYLKDNGWVRQKRPNPINGKRMRLKEFAQKFSGHAIVHAGKTHLTYIADGKIFDTWNPEDSVLHSYWVPKNEVQ